MAATGTFSCLWCKTDFEARIADRNRGWAQYCCKGCKAKHQTKTTGINGANYRAMGKSVTQMKAGHFTKSKFSKKRAKHDGTSEMAHKKCHYCGAPAVNGVYSITGIEWLCSQHMDNSHPFSSDALGQD